MLSEEYNFWSPTYNQLICPSLLVFFLWKQKETELGVYVQFIMCKQKSKSRKRKTEWDNHEREAYLFSCAPLHVAWIMSHNALGPPLIISLSISLSSWFNPYALSSKFHQYPSFGSQGNERIIIIYGTWINSKFSLNLV